MTDQKDIMRFLQILHGEEVFEIRVIGLQGKHQVWDGYARGTASGYFDELAKAVRTIELLDQAKPKGIYVTLNPINESLLARANNRFIGSLPSVTREEEILCLRHMLIDLDPVRPPGISSSNQELELARRRAEEVVSYLQSRNWPDPLIIGMSGNGYHVVYLLDDLPNIDENGKLVKAVVKALSDKLSDEQMKIDTSVSHSSCLTKVLGTIARKGDDTEERPHRRSFIEHGNPEAESVHVDLMRRIVAEERHDDNVDENAQICDQALNQQGKLDVRKYLEDHEVKLKKIKPHGNAVLFILEECLFDQDHRGGESAIVQGANGSLSYQCFHDSCQGKTWQEARKIISGDDSLKRFIIGKSRQAGAVHTKNHSEVPKGENSELSHLLPAPPPFPMEVLPQKHQQVVEQATRAFAVPVEIPVCTLISLTGACVGRARGIVAKQGWVQYPNLYIALVARSGIGKSPCSKAFFDALFDIEHKRFLEYQRDLEHYQLEIEARRQATRGGDLPPLPGKPVLQQIYVDDTTLESLTDAFEGNPKGILWYRDELAGLFQDMDKYSSSGKDGGTKSRLMTAYDSGPWKRNRRSTGCSNIRHACLSIFGTVQGGILPQLFTNLDAATGFLPRFLFVRAEPVEPAFWSDEVFDDENRRLIMELTEALISMNFDRDGNPLLIQIAPEALLEYKRWFDLQAAEPWIDFDGHLFEALSAKLRGQCLRMCLILHILESVANRRSELNPVSVETMRKAVILANWFKEHQRQVWQFLGKAGQLSEASPLERRVAAAIVELENEIDQGMIPTSRIAEKINEGAGEGFRVSKETIGKCYKKLGLTSGHLPDKSARGVGVTLKKIRELKSSIQKSVRSVPKPYAATISERDSSPDKCPKCPEGKELLRTLGTVEKTSVPTGNPQYTTIWDGSDGFSGKKLIPYPDDLEIF